MSENRVLPARYLGFVLVLLVALAGGALAGPSPGADLVLLGGKIVTVDKDFSIAQAVAVRDGRLEAVGTDDEIKALAGPETKVIDLKGRTVIPGLIDGHAHMDREGLRYIFPSLGGAQTKAEILAAVAQEVKKAKPGDWIVTMPIGTAPFYFDALDLLKKGEVPTRWELDRISPDNPVYIRHIWGYWNKPPLLSVLNSKALQACGITARTVAPYGGIQLEKDEITGEPTGVVLEWSYVPTTEFSLFKAAPRFTREQRVSALKRSMEVYNSFGTTSIYEGHGIAPEVQWVYKDLWTKGEMTVRSYLVVSPAWDSGSSPDKVLRDWAAYAGSEGFGDDFLHIGGVFLQLGGDVDVARLCKAALPYTAWAAYIYEALDPKQFENLTAVLVNGGFRFNSIAGNPDPVLDYLEKVDKETPLTGQRVVLEHISSVRPESIPRLKKLGVICTSIAPSSIWKAGPAVVETAKKTPDTVVPLRALMDAGIPTVLCTDNVPPSMLFAIWVAVARQERTTGAVVAPNQKLTREQALRAATINGAYLMFAEDKLGSLERGKLADLVVLDQDLLTCPEENIKDIQVLATMVGGNWVYQAEGKSF